MYTSPNIIKDKLNYAADGGNDRSYAKRTIPCTWVDYSNGAALGRYSLLADDSVTLRSTFASWLGSFSIDIPTANTKYTLSFDYVADATSAAYMDNDGVNDNVWNYNISATTTKQSYVVTRTPNATGNIKFYFRRVNGGNITISNFRFFKTEHVLSLVGSQDGTAVNGMEYSPAYGGAFNFDGTSDYIEVPEYTKHHSSQGTIEAWVKAETITGDRYVFGAGSTTTYGASRALRVNASKWSLVGYGSANTQDINEIADASTAVWQHVAYGWNGTTVYFYLNGSRSTHTASQLVTPLGNILRIGCPPWTTGSAWDGQITLVRHHPTALTEAQMKQNFNAHRKRFNI